VSIPVKFANADVIFQTSLNEKGELGLIVLSADPWKHPPYSKLDSFKERQVTIGTDWKLAGTLSVPAGPGPFPGIVLVHDAGTGDQDETIGAVKVFKDLAEGLASHGVVVLRYETRTKAYPTVSQAKEYTADSQTIEDAVLAAGVLRAQPEVKPGRVYELGFGFGGYVLPRVAEADGKLAGMVIVNGNARPLEDLALDEAQYEGITGRQLVVIQEEAARIKKLTQGDVDTPPLLGMLGPYLLDLKDYDAAREAKLLGLPMLILQGERSFPVDMKDLAAWKTGLQGMKNVTLKSYPALDRVLAPGTGKSATTDYRKPGQHVAPEVIDDVAKWVNQ
jgi:dienelactone hydrolase